MTLQPYITGHTAAELAESIEQSIRQGAIPAGDALPPIRQLAESLGLSAGTVASAYRVLNARGLTSSDRRRGTWVRELRKGDLAPVRQAIPVPEGVIDCSNGNPDKRLLPDPVAALAGLTYEPALYGATVAHTGFLAEARRRLGDDGVPTEHATVSFGALDAISRVLLSNLAPGDRVAIEDPGWAALIDLVERLGYLPVPLPVDPEGPTAEGVWQALAAGARAVVVTARAQNPTGASISAERADDLRAVFARYPGRLVIEDDHACGLVELPLSLVAGPTGRYAFVRSLAKGYGPDLRLAVVAGDASTIGRLEVVHRDGSGLGQPSRPADRPGALVGSSRHRTAGGGVGHVSAAALGAVQRAGGSRHRRESPDRPQRLDSRRRRGHGGERASWSGVVGRARGAFPHCCSAGHPGHDGGAARGAVGSLCRRNRNRLRGGEIERPAVRLGRLSTPGPAFVWRAPCRRRRGHLLFH